ncbi:hypothetical protein [Sinomonas sp. G460-2]|uniref:hypothetical protein n=1 Tax=Sinomonas sp. G460-2 TaxID=3393464 RepID=UPI0039EF3862
MSAASGAWSSATNPSAPDGSAPDVLELRVHGIRNSPPQDLLGTPTSNIALAQDGVIPLGDSLAGFYTVREPLPGQKTHLEAYSWGNLDRFLRGNSLLGKAGRTLYNLGWFIVAPFGFSNAAYWARSFRPDASREGGLRTGSGGGVVRVFALLLTLWLVAAVSTVAFDLVAVQCFLPTGVPNSWKLCSALPSQFDGLRELTRGQRLAALSLAPIAAVVLVGLLGFASNVRFRTRALDAARARGLGAEHDAFALAVPALWVRRRINSPTGTLHIAASLLLVVILLMSDAAAHDGAAPVSLLSVAAVELAAVGYVVAWWSRSVRPPLVADFWARREVWAYFLLGTAILTYVACVVVEATTPTTDQTAPFTAGQLTPTVILVLLTILATVGCVVRSGYREWIATAVLTVGVLALVVAVGGWLDPLGWAANAAAIAVVVLSGVGFVVPYVVLRRREPRRHEHAWHGAGPGVFMFVALLIGAFLASAVALGTGSYLRSGRLQSLPDRGDPLFRDVSIPAGAHDIAVPTVFWAFGGVLVLMVLFVIALLGVPAWFGVQKGEIENPPVDPSEKVFKSEIEAVRRSSAFMQRAEPLLHTVSWVIGVTVTVSLAFTVMRQARGQTGRWAWVLGVLGSWLGGRDGLAAFTAFAEWAVLTSVVLGALAVLTVAIANSATTGASRPLGLLWDLMAWLPRAAHPFGPACFSERAVPELADRMIRWLEPDGAPAPTRRVLLATHSLGTVLGVASLFHLAALGRADLLNRVRLLTFGMQLRPYFGRFFPELFGPEVLGTPGVAAPSFWTADPWKGKDLHDAPSPSRERTAASVAQAAAHRGDSSRSVAGTPLTELLNIPEGTFAIAPRPQPVWINLWRRTDYLGFPGYSYSATPNNLDRVTLEMEPDSYMARVATHDNYFMTLAYLEARDDLLVGW